MNENYSAKQTVEITTCLYHTGMVAVEDKAMSPKEVMALWAFQTPKQP